MKFMLQKVSAAFLIYALIVASCAANQPLQQLETTTRTEARSNDARPNVIVILSDDQGWGDLSINGNKNLKTPNIDALATAGARFERFYVCPVCSPTRAEFLTGRYHPRSGVFSTSAGGERMNLSEITIADTFQAAGYATGAFGKWHNGMQFPYHPNGRGFQEFYGFCSGHWGHYFDPMLEHNGRIVKGNGFVVDDFTDHLLKFVEQNRDQPFFAYLPLNTPHSPMQVPDRWWKDFEHKKLVNLNRSPEKEKQQHTRAALAMCENIDWNVGRITAKLKELDLHKNTIVIYFCDNGPNGARWNGEMKGRKGSTDEGGVRSPLHIRWPDRIQPGRIIRTNGAAIDLLPTLAEVCDVPLIGQNKLDGISLANTLVSDKKRQNEAHDQRIIFSHWNNKVSARTQRFRLGHKGQLFDIDADPRQDHNVANEHPEVTKRLKLAVENFRENVLAGYRDHDRPFILGHPQFRWTQVPARDGTAHGNITRSNKFPNCSFFSNWKSTDDRITWDVEVAHSGKYKVQLYYCCRPEDVGTVMQLTCGSATAKVKIETAHDPPLVGAKADRFKRIESYIRDFKPISMGAIDLEKGKSKLSLEALVIPGNQSIDFRLLMFERTDFQP